MLRQSAEVAVPALCGVLTCKLEVVRKRRRLQEEQGWTATTRGAANTPR
jgi:hypothetical protein